MSDLLSTRTDIEPFTSEEAREEFVRLLASALATFLTEAAPHDREEEASATSDAGVHCPIANAVESEGEGDS